MRFGYRDACLRHDTGRRHPESSDRLRAVRRGLSDAHGVEYVDADPATREELHRVHDPDYVDAVEDFCDDGGGTWDADTVAVEATWDAAVAAAGLARWAALDALDGRQGRETPFAIGRPPGHHAEPADAMGFCFFNNAAVAAEAALAEGADRVAVFDWDVHHGNGTQDAFYDRGDVLYASAHEEGLFPGTGDIEETGTGDGEGATVNVPLPGGCGDPEYDAVVDEVILPAVDGFDPDLFVVSAGFDAHERDVISRMKVTSEGYGHLADRLRSAVDAPVAYVLEGGYGLDALSESVRTIHEVFDGRDPVEPDGEADDDAREVVERAREVHDL